MNSRTVLGAAAGLVLVACSERSSRTRPRDTAAVAPAPAERLAIRAGSTEVWYTLAQSDSGPAGTCTERTLEIRRANTRIAVPLLYTGEPPVPVDDTTIRALLWRKCRPIAAYLIDLRTGQPRLEKR